jgi:inosine-uridine nucleoside N-ribohydrolase
MRLILDVDTGVDDALALALAVRHPAIQLESVLTVVGNVSLELTTRNTLRVLDWLGATAVPVYAGAAKPLSGPVREAGHWHGLDGLGGANLPDSARTAHGGAVTHLVERVMAEPGQLTLVCTAPLTNLALAVQREPRIVGAVSKVVLMGGAARRPGNVTPTAEFNIYADPAAATIVFEQSWPVTMVGLDVTHRVTLTRSDREALMSNPSPEAVLLREVTRQLFDIRMLDDMALHDPLAVAVAVEPDLVTTIHKDVNVETQGTHTLGETVVDLRPATAPASRNTHVCVDVDVSRFRSWFYKTLHLEDPNHRREGVDPVRRGAHHQTG